MASKLFVFLLVGFLSFSSSSATPSSACNGDNCLRALRASTRDVKTASSFCSSYLSTLRGTVTVTTTTTTTTTPIQQTATTTVGTTTLTSNTICYTTVSATATVFVKREDSTLPPNNPLGKRDNAVLPPNVPLEKRADSPFSPYITSACPKIGTTSIQARITSACACFLSSATTTSTFVSTVTASRPAPTTVTTSFAATQTTNVCTSTSTITATSTISTAGTCTNLPNPYTAPNNDRFNLHCGSYYFADPGVNRLLDITVGSIVQCYNLCATTPNCVAADYFQPGTSTDGGFNCYLLSDTSLGSTAFSQADAAELIQ